MPSTRSPSRPAACEQLGDLLRQVLAVGVEGDHAVEAAAEQVGEGDGEGRALAAVAREGVDPRPGAARLLGRAVGRAVVHHQHLGQLGAGRRAPPPHRRRRPGRRGWRRRPGGSSGLVSQNGSVSPLFDIRKLTGGRLRVARF